MKRNREEIELLKIEREYLSQLVEDLFAYIEERVQLHLILDDQLPLMIMQVDKMIGQVQIINLRIADLEDEMNNRWRRVERLREQEMNSDIRKVQELFEESLAQYSTLESSTESGSETLSHPHEVSSPEKGTQGDQALPVHKPGIWQRFTIKFGHWFAGEHNGVNK